MCFYLTTTLFIENVLFMSEIKVAFILYQYLEFSHSRKDISQSEVVDSLSRVKFTFFRPRQTEELLAAFFAVDTKGGEKYSGGRDDKKVVIFHALLTPHKRNILT